MPWGTITRRREFTPWTPTLLILRRNDTLFVLELNSIYEVLYSGSVIGITNEIKLDFPCSFTYLNHKFYPVLQKNIKIVNKFQKQTKTKKSSINCVTITVAVDT